MSPELIQLLSELSPAERSQLLCRFQSLQGGMISQVNSDNSNGWQVLMEDGVANVANTINIHNYKFDIPEEFLEEFLRKLQEKPNKEPYESPWQNNTIDLDDDCDVMYDPSYEISRIYSYRNILETVQDFSGFIFPSIAGIVFIFGAISLFSGARYKDAVVNHAGGVYLRDDVGNKKEVIPFGTNMKLSEERDGKYCKTERGWIYCQYLTVTESEKNIAQNSIISPPKNTNTATVYPEEGKGAANIRVEPNAGKVIGQINKNQKVQIVQCVSDSCEVISESIRGWIYKPYLRH